MYRLWMVMNDFSKEVNRNNISALASSAAYFIFMSLIPVLMLICAIIPYTPITEADLMNLCTNILPHSISPLIVNMIAEVYDKSPAAISISAVITLWSAAKGIMAIERGINLVNRVEETRNYILLRCQAACYTVIMLVVVVFFLFIMVFGNVLISIIFHKYPDLSHFWHFMMNFRFFFVWFALTIIFSLLYTWLPNRKTKFSMQIPGAFFSSIIWSAFSWAFSIYVEHFNTFSVYGSLATIIIVMLWLYVCMYIFLIGAEINQYFVPFIRYYLHGRINHRKQKV